MLNTFTVSFLPSQKWLRKALKEAKAGTNISIDITVIDAGDNCKYKVVSSVDELDYVTHAGHPIK